MTRMEVSCSLFFAAVNNDLTEVKKCLAQSPGADINRISEEFDATPLIAACSSGNYEMVSYLLELGAEVNKTGQQNYSALEAAISSKNRKTIELLIRHGADVNHNNYAGGPLFAAIISRNVEIVRILLNSGALPDGPDPDEDNPLFLAIRLGAVEVFKLLMEHSPCYEIKIKARDTGVVYDIYTVIEDIRKEKSSKELVEASDKILEILNDYVSKKLK